MYLRITFKSNFTAKSIKPCPKTSNFDTCLKQVLEDIKPSLDRGDFGDGFKVASMEPMHQNSMKIMGPDLNISMTDLIVKGATTYKVVSVKSDLQKLSFDLGFLTPKLTYTAKYSVSQKFPVLNADIKGQGNLSGVLSKYRIMCLTMNENNVDLTLDRVHARIRVRFVIVGDQVRLKKVQYKMKIDDGRFKITSLRNVNEKNGESNVVFTEVKLV